MNGQVAPTGLALPRRPEIYKQTDDLPLGSYAPQQLADGQWTVVRLVNLLRWFPITSRANPMWLRWPRREGAVAFMNMLGGCDEWPHWGTGDMSGSA